MSRAHFPDDIRMNDPRAPWNEIGVLGACSHCGKPIPESDEHTTTRIYDGYYLCSECSDNDVKICDSCGFTTDDAPTFAESGEHYTGCTLTVEWYNPATREMWVELREDTRREICEGLGIVIE